MSVDPKVEERFRPAAARHDIKLPRYIIADRDDASWPAIWDFQRQLMSFTIAGAADKGSRHERD